MIKHAVTSTAILAVSTLTHAHDHDHHNDHHHHPATITSPTNDALAYADSPINHLQVIGSHNSYKRAIQSELKAIIESQFNISLDSIDYSHIPVLDQLNLGLRNLEFDVYWDPKGGLYTPPAAHALMRQAGITPDPWDPDDQARTPGFKVIHDLDADFTTWYVNFEPLLVDLREWSRAHPNHLPIIVTMNCKEGRRRIPGAIPPAPFTPDSLAILDNTIRNFLTDDHLITPDDIRRNHEHLRDAVLAEGWPTAVEAAGKFIFVLDHAGETRDEFLEAKPGARDAVFFPLVNEDQPEAAIFVINDPIKEHDRIRNLVSKGFIVRTRADAGTKEARNESFDRFNAAKSSGAQVITTDYYIPDRSISDIYTIRFDNGSYVRTNPITSTIPKQHNQTHKSPPRHPNPQ